jgi:hypothetical protein
MSETAPTAPAAPLLGGEAPAGTGTAPPPAGNAAAAPPAAAPDAREWLPEPFRANPVFKDIASVDALAKSYDSAARLVGLDKGAVLRLPAAEDAPEWGEVYAKLGRPETPEAYQFPELPAGLVEGVEPAARAEFHKLGLSGKQAAGVMGLYGAQVQQAEQARLARAAEVEAAVEADLKREWGDAFEDRLHAANRAIAEVGGKELGELLANTRMPDGTRMGNHPMLVKAFAELGRRIAEPGDLRGGSGGASSPASYTPDQALAEIKRLTTDPAFHAARRDPKHEDHAKNTELWNRLNQAAAAGRSWVA